MPYPQESEGPLDQSPKHGQHEALPEMASNSQQPENNSSGTAPIARATGSDLSSLLSTGSQTDIENAAQDPPIIGRETASEALKAVNQVLAKDAELAALLSRRTIPHRSDRVRPVRKCPRCETGHLHSIGQNCGEDGTPGLGGQVVCDSCGYHVGVY